MAGSHQNLIFRTNQTANKRGRQKKRVNIFLNFTYLHKTQPGQKTAWNFPNFFEEIYSPYVWAFKFGCRSKHLPIPRSYGTSNSRPLFVFSISELLAFLVLNSFLKSLLKLTWNIANSHEVDTVGLGTFSCLADERIWHDFLDVRNMA